MRSLTIAMLLTAVRKGITLGTGPLAGNENKPIWESGSWRLG